MAKHLQRRYLYRKTVVLCAGMALCFMFTACGTAAPPSSASETQDGAIAIVGGCAVPLEEYQLFAYDSISQIAQAFSQKYGVDPNSAEFWETSFDGQTPTEALKKSADIIMHEQKALQIVAQNLGVLQSADYSEFVLAFHAENESRSQGLQNDEVIYGPKSLAIEQYYTYRQSQIIEALEEYVENEIIAPTEADIKAFYPKLALQESRKNYKGTLGFFYWSAGNTISDEDIASAIRRAVNDNTQGAQAALNATNAVGTEIGYKEENVNTRELGKENEEYNSVIRAIHLLEKGGQSEVFSVRDNECIAIVLDKTYETFGSYEDTRDYTETMYRVRESKAVIKQKIADVQMEFTPAYNKLTIKDLKG